MKSPRGYETRIKAFGVAVVLAVLALSGGLVWWALSQNRSLFSRNRELIQQTLVEGFDENLGSIPFGCLYRAEKQIAVGSANEERRITTQALLQAVVGR